jgi:phosphoglucomutase
VADGVNTPSGEGNAQILDLENKLMPPVEQKISPLAGKLAPPDILINLSELLDQYYSIHPDAANPLQKVSFGTSGHRGSAANGTFNEDHILAISQAVSEYRANQGINGPLFIGRDTHALSAPAQKTALEVLAANGIDVYLTREEGDAQYTPTPAVSHAILAYNRGKKTDLADGIIITPSHNPRPMAALNIIPPLAALPNRRLPNGFSNGQMSFWQTGTDK